MKGTASRFGARVEAFGYLSSASEWQQARRGQQGARSGRVCFLFFSITPVNRQEARTEANLALYA